MFTIFNRRLSDPDLMRRVVEATVQDRFFTVSFTKADGSYRQLNCRLGVNKHKKGGRDCNTNKQMMTVWDTGAKGYRNVNLSTIKYIIADGVKLEFQG